MTVYANVVNDEVKGVYDLIPKFWNGINNFNVRCENDENYMHQNGFVKIIRDTTPFDSSTHVMSDFPTYRVQDGNVYEQREINPIPPVVAPSRDDLLIDVRAKRDELMNAFEWRYSRYARQVRLGITPTDTLELLDAYMQSLADITLQEDLNNIIWPTFEG